MNSYFLKEEDLRLDVRKLLASFSMNNDAFVTTKALNDRL